MAGHEIKSLDGTVQQADHANKVVNPQSKVELASHSKEQNGGLSLNSLPPPGHQLTGKQEHC